MDSNYTKTQHRQDNDTQRDRPQIHFLCSNYPFHMNTLNLNLKRVSNSEKLDFSTHTGTNNIMQASQTKQQAIITQYTCLYKDSNGINSFALI